MVDFPVDTNIFKIADQITTPVAKTGNEEWFAEDIMVLTSNANKGTTVVIDFSYSVTSLIEYTLDGGTTFIPFNNGDPITGGQSRYIRVTSGVLLNFRAAQAGTLNRVIVGEV